MTRGGGGAILSSSRNFWHRGQPLLLISVTLTTKLISKGNLDVINTVVPRRKVECKINVRRWPSNETHLSFGQRLFTLTHRSLYWRHCECASLLAGGECLWKWLQKCSALISQDTSQSSAHTTVTWRYDTKVRLCLFFNRKTQRLQTMPRGSKNSIVSQNLHTAALGGFDIRSLIHI